MIFDESTDWSWLSVRGTLLHRAVLHPATLKLHVGETHQRDSYVKAVELFATFLHDALGGSGTPNYPLARALLNAGGETRDKIVDLIEPIPSLTESEVKALPQHERRIREWAAVHHLNDADSRCAMNDLPGQAKFIAERLMWKAGQKDSPWEWMISEVSAPFAYARRETHDSEHRIDLLVGRTHAAPLAIEIKTGLAEATDKYATDLLEGALDNREGVAAKYGHWIGRQTQRATELQVLYVDTRQYFSKWSTSKWFNQNGPHTSSSSS